jgi:hypothetical protein
LSQTIEAHYSWMAQHLGPSQLTALYNLLDQLIALEVPGGQSQEAETATPEE